MTGLLRRLPGRYLPPEDAEAEARKFVEPDENLAFARFAYLETPAGTDAARSLGFELTVGLVVAITDHRVLFLERTMTNAVTRLLGAVDKSDIVEVGVTADDSPGETVRLITRDGGEVRLHVGRSSTPADVEDFVRLAHSG